MCTTKGIALLIRCCAILSTCCYLAACCADSKPSPNTGRKIKAVWVVNHGWHTGIIVPAVDSAVWLPKLKQRFPTARYLEFGWGDRAFYQARKMTIGLTVKAILWPTNSVMFVRALPDIAGSGFSHEIIAVCFDLTEYHALLQYLAQSFYRGSDDNIVEVGEPIYYRSAFFQANGKYYLTNTCNKWTAKGLQNAGLDISPAFKFTADSIMRHLEQLPSNCYPDSQMN